MPAARSSGGPKSATASNWSWPNETRRHHRVNRQRRAGAVRCRRSPRARRNRPPNADPRRCRRRDPRVGSSTRKGASRGGAVRADGLDRGDPQAARRAARIEREACELRILVALTTAVKGFADLVEELHQLSLEHENDEKVSA